MVPTKGQTRRRILTAGGVIKRLNRSLPAGVAVVLRGLEAHGAEAVIVGGAVRNAFLGLDVHDWDIATNVKPSAVAGLFKRVVRTGEKHGTIMVLTDSGPVEVTTYRGEGPYVDGRRPSHVVFHDNLEADLARRDFTINAMAVDLRSETVVDPFGGQTDLRKRRVRCVGDPAERFAEDGLRPLRAVRFAAVLGFEIEEQTRRALRGSLESFRKVAWERNRDEMQRLLAGTTAGLGYALGILEKSRLLDVLAPELRRTSEEVVRAMDRLEASDPWLRFACWAAGTGLDGAAAADILSRWRVARSDCRRVERRVDALAELPDKPPRDAGLRRWLAHVGAEEGRDAAKLAALLRSGAFRRLPAGVERELAQQPPLRLKDLAVNGGDLEAAGFSGPEIGDLLHQLLLEVVDEPLRNQRELLLKRAHSLSTGQRRR